MQFSYEWLREYVDLDEDPRAAADALTRVGMSVELIEEHEKADRSVDSVLDIDVTTNRPDAMNHVGLAREAAVALGRELELPESGAPGALDGDVAGAQVRVEAPDLCPRFTARVIEGVTVGPSPQWMIDRLEAIGLRSINNVVDVTNFLLWEWGQPQHAYDLDTLAERTIVVRPALGGEKITTLDGEERELEDGMLLICDATRPIGIAGVMGGLETEVTERTTTILLESAWFDPQSVRRTARRLGMHTDASHRFERGADFDLALRANDRACHLIAELTGGRVLEGAIDVCSARDLPECRVLDLDPASVSAFAGCEVPESHARRWLEGLGFGVDTSGGAMWRVEVPSWRALDVERRADLFEEVLREFGYDDIPAALPAMAGADAPATAEQKRRQMIRTHLVAAGFAEAINWAFHDLDADRSVPTLVDGGDPDGGPLRIANALSERYGVMRRSMLPGLIESARFNLRRGASRIRLFEIGHVFGSEECEAVGMVLGGAPGEPWQKGHALDFFDLKGVVEHLAESLSSRLELRTAPLVNLVHGASAEIWSTVEGGGEAIRRVGLIGQLDDHGLAFPLFVAELRCDALGTAETLGRLGKTQAIEAPSRYPGITADLTLTHSLELPWRELESAIEEIRAQGNTPELVSFALKDRYTGQGVPKGAVNTTMSFLYSSTERSLTQEEINAQHESLAAQLRQRFQMAD